MVLAFTSYTSGPQSLAPLGRCERNAGETQED